jgi:hypothetical protein
MDLGKASFLAEELCLSGNVNEYYRNPPVDHSHLDCNAAGRKIYCAPCALRHSIQYEFTAPESAFSWLPLIIRSTSKSKIPRKSKTSLGKEERQKMRTWMIDFRRVVWSEFEPFSPILSHYPVAWFFPDTIINDILNNFLKIKTIEELESLLQHHSWKYTNVKSSMLFRLIIDFQLRIYEWRKEEEVEKESKRQVGKVKKVKQRDFDTESSMEEEANCDGSVSEGEETQDVETEDSIAPKPSASSTSSRPRRPREPLQSMKEAAAEYGPVRTNRRR